MKFSVETAMPPEKGTGLYELASDCPLNEIRQVHVGQMTLEEKSVTLSPEVTGSNTWAP